MGTLIRLQTALALTALAFAASAQGEAAAPLTPDDYARAEQFLPRAAAPLVANTVAHLTWMPDGRFWYVTTTADGWHYVMVDPRHGTRTPAFDEAKLAAALSASVGAVPHGAAGDPGEPPVDVAHLPFRTLEIGAGGREISFQSAAAYWRCDLERVVCTRSTAPNPDEALSPDGTRAAFLREDNLWVREVVSGVERPLTRDGVKDFGYATDNPGWEHTARAILTWSPDSRKIATYRQDQRNVGEMYLVGTRLGHPQLEAWKYPMAGDAAIATIERVIIDLDSGRIVRLDIPPDPHRSSPCYDVQCGDGTLADAQWSADARELAFVSTSRDHRRAVLRIADAGSGSVHEILAEEAPSYYESDISSTSHGAVNWRYLPASHDVIWFSERDDHAHLYLYDAKTGALKHRITGGDWNVVEILRIDERRRQIYFTAVGREQGEDPYFVHLYRVGFDGRDFKSLTPENATHEISMAPSGDFFVDRYSRPDVPTIAVLKDRNGRLVRRLEQADPARLAALGWKPPRPFTTKARDGTTDLYGLLFEPSRFDPSRKYPVVVRVYPGPQIGSVGSRHFVAARGDAQSLAELGFIVVLLDGMGTPFRSKRFHDVSYGNLRDNTLPDQVSALKQLAERYPFLDLDRAGIYGHSGGGYAAAAALFMYPDFFKVGVAESGNHDQLGYTDDWGEKFIGLLERRPDGTSSYAGQDTESIAQNLKGHLLLMHGTLDDNVPPYLTLLLADALIRANKDFDLLLLPNQRHLYEGESERYAMRRRWDYFVRYLDGAEPPHEYTMHRLPDVPGTDE